ncbi:MAG TPA: hypothetical protein H9899_06355 [Candidatus Sphingomonas excrementigallinarum]|nr:hypothetical protein [Candidatus Sphingomonas excrementigallinarum]
MAEVVKVIVSNAPGPRGPRGLASGPLGAGAVDSETISDDAAERAAIADKLLQRPEGESQSSGVDVLRKVTTGARNTGFGFQALKEDTGGSENTGFGYQALSQVTGGSDPAANFNSAFGAFALSKLTTGYKNAAYGRAAANWLTTGYHNTALGYGAFHWAKTAVNCTAVGFEAAHGGDGSVNFAAQGITAVGFRALYNCTANFNTALGTAAGFSLTTGERNVAVGVNALNTAATCSDTVAVGYMAGFANTGSGNIFVGTNADSAPDLANVTVIGSGLTATASNTLLLGNGQTIIPGSTSADFGTQAKPWNYGIFGNSVLAHCGRAMPAGGTTGAGVLMSSTPNFGIFFGSGAPTLSAARGSLYLRSDGSGPNNRIYVNADNGTGWTALTTAS